MKGRGDECAKGKSEAKAINTVQVKVGVASMNYKEPRVALDRRCG